MKKLSAVSIFNQNNLMLDDISDEQLKNSNLIIFLEPSEIKDNSDFLNDVFDKVNDYLLLDMVDLSITEDEFKKIYNKNTSTEVNKAMGIDCDYTILPTIEHISNVLNFIDKHDGEDFIVGCSAGVSRSGALAHYLIYRGYSLNEISNKEFFPNSLLLNELILKSNHSFKNKVNVALLSETDSDLILSVKNNIYKYSIGKDDEYTYYLSRKFNEKYCEYPILINDIFFYNGYGLKINKESKFIKD